MPTAASPTCLPGPHAPLSLAARLRELSGVADVQTTLLQMVRVALPGVPDPIVGQLIGIDQRHAHRMNLVSQSAGRPLGARLDGRTDADIEVLVSEAFAQAHRFKPGARLQALINGKDRSLLEVGIALSPEFVFAGLWGMPYARGFDIFWIDRDVLAAAYHIEGAFNRAAFTLAPGAVPEVAAAAVTALVEPFGGRELFTRKEQVSHAMLDNEIKQQRLMGTMLPAIFLAVAAFLHNVVVARRVSTRREQIATLKALGHGNAAITGHYLKLVRVIVATGLLMGIVIGKELGYLLSRLYAAVGNWRPTPAPAWFGRPVQRQVRKSALSGPGCSASRAHAWSSGSIARCARRFPNRSPCGRPRMRGVCTSFRLPFFAGHAARQ